MLLTLLDSTPLANYKILSNSITPRPIAWISTISPSGVLNLAPFSFFSPLCATPVIFGINIMNKSNGELKDTLKNAMETKKATISTVQPQFLESMQQTSNELPHNISEARQYGIPLESLDDDFVFESGGARDLGREFKEVSKEDSNPNQDSILNFNVDSNADSTTIKNEYSKNTESSFPPMVKDTLVAFFCDFRDVLHFSQTQATLILEAKKVFIHDSIYTESLNFTLQNVGRVGKGFI